MQDLELEYLSQATTIHTADNSEQPSLIDTESDHATTFATSEECTPWKSEQQPEQSCFNRQCACSICKKHSSKACNPRRHERAHKIWAQNICARSRRSGIPTTCTPNASRQPGQNLQRFLSRQYQHGNRGSCSEDGCEPPQSSGTATVNVVSEPTAGVSTIEYQELGEHHCYFASEEKRKDPKALNICRRPSWEEWGRSGCIGEAAEYGNLEKLLI